MTHIIKLESGDYLNLDQMLRTGEYEVLEGHYALMVGNVEIKLSPKDLEKIEKIAEYSDFQETPPQIMEPPLGNKLKDEWAKNWREKHS